MTYLDTQPAADMPTVHAEAPLETRVAALLPKATKIRLDAALARIAELEAALAYERRLFSAING